MASNTESISMWWHHPVHVRYGSSTIIGIHPIHYHTLFCMAHWQRSMAANYWHIHSQIPAQCLQRETINNHEVLVHLYASLLTWHETHFTDDCSTKIQIWWKMQFLSSHFEAPIFNVLCHVNHRIWSYNLSIWCSNLYKRTSMNFKFR